MVKSQQYTDAVQVGEAEKIHVGEGAGNRQEMDGKIREQAQEKRWNN